jgi:hypothetical protein
MQNFAKQATTSPMPFCVLTDEDSAVVVAAALRDENMFFASSTTFLIRIEKSIRDCEISDVDLESSIILHNLSNVYKCLAITATTPASAKEICQAALKIYELSYAIFRRNTDEEFQRSCWMREQ